MICFCKLVVTQGRTKIRYSLIFWNMAGNGVREFSITLLGYPRRCVLRITQIRGICMLGMHWKPSATGALLLRGAGRPEAGQKLGMLAVAVAVAAEVVMYQSENRKGLGDGSKRETIRIGFQSTFYCPVKLLHFVTLLR